MLEDYLAVHDAAADQDYLWGEDERQVQAELGEVVAHQSPDLLGVVESM